MLTIEGSEPVLILDLSQVGARLACRSRNIPKRGILSWMEFESYGEKVWERGNMCGIRFEEELDLDVILMTRRRAPEEWKRNAEEAISAAEKWVRGS